MACPEDIWRGVHASPTTRCAAWARNDVWGSGKNGLTLRESHLICEAMALTGALVGMEMVELNPTLDHANTTGELAVC